MKVGDPLLPTNPESAYDRQLNKSLLDYLRKLVNKLNGIASGVASHMADNAATAAPTTGTYAQGDFVANSNRVEAGSASSKYVLMGWVCVAGGEPGTWVECRVLTGN